MKSCTVTPPGASVRSVPYGDARRVAVIFACARCEAEHETRFPGSVNLEFAQKKARAAGWHAEIRRSGANRCVECLAQRSVAPIAQPSTTRRTSAPGRAR